jgi:hypothetical protein
MIGLPARATLSGLLLALAAVIAVTWVVMDRWQARVLESPPGSERPVERAEPVLLPDDSGLQGPEGYPALIERPLFMSTRSPPVTETEDDQAPEAEPEADPEEPLPELSDLRLTSVIITPDERHAWFLVSGTDEILRLSMGDTLREWLLHQVEETHVVFRARREEMRLELRPLGRGVDLAPGERAAPRARE